MSKPLAFSTHASVNFSLPCFTHPHLCVPHGFFGRPSFSNGEMIPCDILFQQKEEIVTRMNTYTRKHLQKIFHISQEFSVIAKKQIHSNICTLLEEPQQALPEGDAIVTQCPGTFLKVITADCGPIFIHDTEKPIISIIHAGWRGALDGIIENAIHMMESLGSQKKHRTAVLGPTIRSSHYEVDTSFLEKFLMASPHNGIFFTPTKDSDHFFFDLPKYIMHRMEPLVGKAYDMQQNTFGTTFFSRRHIIEEENLDPPELFQNPVYRNISLIGLPFSV